MVGRRKTVETDRKKIIHGFLSGFLAFRARAMVPRTDSFLGNHMDEARNTDEVVEHQMKSSNFKWSLADDSSLRKALHEYQVHCFDRASGLQHEIAMVGQKTLELNAELECMNANINCIANVKFMEQRLDDDYNTLTPLGKAVLAGAVDNTTGLREDTLTTLTNAIHQGIEDVRSSQNISTICLALSIIGSSEFYSSISSSELIPIERSTQRSTRVSTSSAPRSLRKLIECCDEERVHVPLLPHERNAEVQKHVDMLPSSSVANFCLEKCTANLDGPVVFGHRQAVHPDQLTRVPLFSTESDEDRVRPFVHTSGIKKRSMNNLNWTGEQGVTTGANLPQQRPPATADHKRSDAMFGCSRSSEGNRSSFLRASTSDSSVLGNFIKGLSSQESLFESTDAQQQNVDVIIDKLLGNTENSSNGDLKATSEKLSTNMHVQPKCVIDTDAKLSTLTDIHSGQKNLVTTAAWPLSSITKTRCRGPVRRPSNKIRSSTIKDHGSSDVLSRTFATHCEDISEVQSDNSLHQRETVGPGMPSLQPVMSTSIENNRTVNRVDAKSIHSFFDSESEDERRDGDEIEVPTKDCEARATTVVGDISSACTTFVKTDYNNLNKSRTVSNSSEPLRKSLFLKSLFHDDDDNDDLSMFRKKIAKK